MVWDVARKSVVVKHDTGSTVMSALSWRPEPGANTLAGIGVDGQIRVWCNIIPEDMRGPAAPHEDAAPSLAQQSAEEGDAVEDNAGDPPGCCSAAHVCDSQGLSIQGVFFVAVHACTKI